MCIQIREKEFGDIESHVLPVVIDQIRMQFRKWDKLTMNQRKGIRLRCLSGIKDHHIGYLYCAACGFGKISFLLRYDNTEDVRYILPGCAHRKSVAVYGCCVQPNQLVLNFFREVMIQSDTWRKIVNQKSRCGGYGMDHIFPGCTNYLCAAFVIGCNRFCPLFFIHKDGLAKEGP